jgi:prolyl-tRNA editing enzyme YbaK/EbsC (Cys-tRNA(Pro) deacylase)
MSTVVFDAIRTLLDGADVSYRHIHHEPTFTSEESARARGEDVKVGGKALVVKLGDDFRLFVLSAARSLDSAALKRYFGVKKVRFADRDELLRLTGLVPGSVPPFGRPILPLDLYADPSVLANPVIAFNAGSLTDSLVVPVADYERVAKPTVLTFAQPG